MLAIYQAGDILEAHIVAGMLNANDIAAEVIGQYQQGGVGELATQDFARVWILDERDADRARALIRAYERGDAESGSGDADEGSNETPWPRSGTSRPF